MKKNPIIGCMRWGKWGANFDTNQYYKLINQCIELGINKFDHADIYGDYTTEADFGNALKNNTGLRSKIEIITKTGIQLVCNNKPMHTIKSYNTTKSHIIQSVEQSLKNFNTDYIDELLIHRPDVLLNPAELAETATRLINSGKIKRMGVSNFSLHKLAILQKYIKLHSHQIEINTLQTESFTNGMLDFAFQHNIEIQAWSPINVKLFTLFNEPNYTSNQLIMQAIQKLSLKYHCTDNQILVAFLYAHPVHIVPVIGTTQFERILEAKNAMQINITSEDFYLIYTACMGKEVD
ncbi:MAG: aldo/keto reductase [Sediminibacterium sp.]|nr:aldo/keto reductase [Sediminibacterium sp.]